MRLKDKVALITGGSKGIGRAIADRFVREGARGVVADVDDLAGREAVKALKAAGGEAVYVRADVSQAGDCEEMVRVAERTFGKLNVLVNNAGIMHPEDDDAVKTSEQAREKTLEVTLK